jgi:hypothetical protein
VSIFRDHPLQMPFWDQFRTAPSGFMLSKEAGGYWAFHVVAGEQGAVMLFFSLLAELAGGVTVEIEDKHAERAWKGAVASAAAAREALLPLEQPVIALGGVQIMVFTPSDQLTLNPVRELFIYSQSDRWANLLEGKGIKEQRLVRTKSWKFTRPSIGAAPELSELVAKSAMAMGLIAG